MPNGTAVPSPDTWISPRISRVYDPVMSKFLTFDQAGPPLGGGGPAGTQAYFSQAELVSLTRLSTP